MTTDITLNAHYLDSSVDICSSRRNFADLVRRKKPNRKRNSQNSTDTSANIDRDHACRTGAVAAATKPANYVPNHKEDAQSAT
jgi:hypothetical protein